MTFKERYDNDPEFKANHKKYIMTKIKCECGKEIFAISKRCSSCYRLSSRKVCRPSLEDLIQDLSNSTYVAVGKKYGVSDNAIRKWIKWANNRT